MSESCAVGIIELPAALWFSNGQSKRWPTYLSFSKRIVQKSQQGTNCSNGYLHSATVVQVLGWHILTPSCFNKLEQSSITFRYCCLCLCEAYICNYLTTVLFRADGLVQWVGCEVLKMRYINCVQTYITTGMSESVSHTEQGLEQEQIDKAVPC